MISNESGYNPNYSLLSLTQSISTNSAIQYAEIESSIDAISSDSDGSDEYDYFQRQTNLFSRISTDSLHDDNDDSAFRDNGYIKIHQICNTLQGSLFKASPINKTNANADKYVAIKKTNKLLFKHKIAIDDDASFCVSEDIIKEALILQTLTVHNSPIGNYIIKYIDFFESKTDYFLVMQYVASETTLKQFLIQCRKYIQNGKLSMKHYQNIIKYVLWQLFVTIKWLHLSCSCAHMDLCSENILLCNASFIEKDGNLSINPRICIKICDFGVAEIFENKFECNKHGLSIYNEGLFAPEVFHGELFDGRYADNWMLGMILFECMTVGAVLYGPMNMYKTNSGYSALYQNKLREYLIKHQLIQYFTPSSFSLLSSLLNVHQKQRLRGISILKHRWFKLYFTRYQPQIERKFGHSNTRNVDKIFPYYSINQR